MARSISRQTMAQVRLRAEGAADRRDTFAAWLEGRTDLRLSRQSTSETEMEWRSEPSDPTLDSYHTSNQMGPRGALVRVTDVYLHGTRDGRRESVCLGEYIHVPHDADSAAQEHLWHLRNLAEHAAELLARLEAEIEAGEAAVV